MKRTPKNSGEDHTHGLFARELRMRRNMTLDELAKRTDLSKSHLSRFERGKKSLSLAGIVRVASVLGASVSGLLGENVDNSALHLVRKRDRKVRAAPPADGAYRFAALSRGGSASGPTAFVVEIAAEKKRTSTAYHSGEELLYVIGGEIDVEFPDRKIVLATGDYLQFSGHLKHILKGRAENSELLIIIANAQPDRDHPSPSSK